MNVSIPMKRLGDLFKFKNGRAFKKEEWADTGLPIIRIQNLNSKDAAFNYFSGEFSEDILVRSGDLLFSWSGTVGSSFGSHLWSREPGVLNQHIFKVSHSEEVDRRYAFYALRHITTEIEQQVSGAVGLVHITKERLNEFTIPIPSVEQQQRIVAILDEAFAGIATAKANAEKSRQNVRDLFERYLNLIFNEAWSAGEPVVLADLATGIADGDHMPPPKSEVGVPFITIGNIDKATREIDFNDTFKVPHGYFGALKPNRRPERGDVLYTVTGSFGIPVLVRDDRDFCFQRHIALVRPRPDILSEWLYYLLMSPQVFRQASDGATGTAQKTVSLKLLRGFEVPRLSMDRQREDVARLDSFAAETRRLQSVHQRKLAALDELKQSLLHRAFSGQL